jgi:hypothetical protein
MHQATIHRPVTVATVDSPSVVAGWAEHLGGTLARADVVALPARCSSHAAVRRHRASSDNDSVC